MLVRKEANVCTYLSPLTISLKSPFSKLVYFDEIRKPFPKSVSKTLTHIQSTAKYIFDFRNRHPNGWQDSRRTSIAFEAVGFGLVILASPNRGLESSGSHWPHFQPIGVWLQTCLSKRPTLRYSQWHWWTVLCLLSTSSKPTRTASSGIQDP